MVSMIEEVFIMIPKFMLLGINFDRTKFIISTLSQFKNLDKAQLLMNLKVKYKDERGFDAGNILKILLI